MGSAKGCMILRTSAFGALNLASTTGNGVSCSQEKPDEAIDSKRTEGQLGSFNNEYGKKDNLFKISSGTLEGLEEAERRKKEENKR